MLLIYTARIVAAVLATLELSTGQPLGYSVREICITRISYDISTVAAAVVATQSSNLTSNTLHFFPKISLSVSLNFAWLFIAVNEVTWDVV